MSDHDDHQPSGDEEDDLEARRRFLGEGFESTFFMREIDRPDAVAIREALLARGIDPASAILAEYGPDQMCFIAILLTADERVWQFDVAYELVGARDFWGALSDVRIENWKELTGERKELHRRVVNLGLVLLELARSDRERWQMWWSWASEQVPKDRLAEAIHMVRRRTVELRLSSHAAWRAVRTTWR